ncbi:DNA N6-methyl adenine demethylase-like [Gordionus sp. m RMFG-2023]|uniref:DNA N6-methyl adenine demethylase-like n=1 Tax=Gordionus sp. m RMFG-2023 TaxID=3053472 RepID=UPI0031FBF6AB
MDNSKINQLNICPLHNDILKFNNLKFLSINGVHLYPDSLSKTDEQILINIIDSLQWSGSQSGRRKQDFGPKINFKKQKIKNHNCIKQNSDHNILTPSQFPGFSLLINILKNYDIINNFTKFFIPEFKCYKNFDYPFIPVELCNLEYNPIRGSHIEPHFDDFWAWGPRLVTFNLLSDTVLTLSDNNDQPSQFIEIYLPRRSLLIIEHEARYEWKHSIDPNNINERRIAITLREFSKEIIDLNRN